MGKTFSKKMKAHSSDCSVTTVTQTGVKSSSLGNLDFKVNVHENYGQRSNQLQGGVCCAPPVFYFCEYQANEVLCFKCTNN